MVVNSSDSDKDSSSTPGKKTVAGPPDQTDDHNNLTQSKNLHIDIQTSHDNHKDTLQSAPAKLTYLLEERLSRLSITPDGKPLVPPKPKPRSRSSSGGSSISLDIKDHVSSAPLVSPMDEKPEEDTALISQLSPPVPKPRRSLSMNDQFDVSKVTDESSTEPPTIPLRTKRQYSQRTESPKRVLRRPSEPPPLPPDFPTVRTSTKKLMPTRPPPPVPLSTSPQTSPGNPRTSRASRSNPVILTTQTPPPITEVTNEPDESEQIYATIDEDMESDNHSPIHNASSETAEHLPKVSIEPPTPGNRHCLHNRVNILLPNSASHDYLSSMLS